MSASSVRSTQIKPALTRVDSSEQAWRQQKPASIRSTGSQKSLGRTSKDTDGVSSYISAQSDSDSVLRSQKPMSILSASASTVSAPALPRLSTQEFDAKLMSLRKETKIARNVLPMLVRGGAIASMGMLLFGHLAPMAIVGVLLGATFGGYAIAKFMQLKIAAKQRAQGDNSDLAQLKRSIPETISDTDRAKLNGLVNFIEKGNVFEAGMVKAVREPFRAVRTRMSAAIDHLTSTKEPASAPEVADRASVHSSSLSAAQTIRETYLAQEKAKAGA